MGKLEKLREINAIIKTMLIDLETYIFIENINIENTKKNQQDIVVDIKQQQ